MFVPSTPFDADRLITETTSNDASGWPSFPVAMPGLKIRSRNCVRVKLLTISDSEPLRSTTICSGSPVAASVV